MQIRLGYECMNFFLQSFSDPISPFFWTAEAWFYFALSFRRAVRSRLQLDPKHCLWRISQSGSTANTNNGFSWSWLTHCQLSYLDSCHSMCSCEGHGWANLFCQWLRECVFLMLHFQLGEAASRLPKSCFIKSCNIHCILHKKGFILYFSINRFI